MLTPRNKSVNNRIIMPGRSEPLITNEIYHVYNRGIHRQPTFTNVREYSRAIECLKYYRIPNPPVRLSKFLRLETERKTSIIEVMKGMEPLVTIFAYCLMPNHFHLLLRQEKDSGISKYLSNFQNSYTRYSNVRHNLDGSLFLNQFKAVRIITDEQLIHVSRYIHLNPYTSYVVNSIDKLVSYKWSSLNTYLNIRNDFVETNTILDLFRNQREYKQFVLDQADYQRQLKKIAYLTLEED